MVSFVFERMGLKSESSPWWWRAEGRVSALLFPENPLNVFGVDCWALVPIHPLVDGLVSLIHAIHLLGDLERMDGHHGFDSQNSLSIFVWLCQWDTFFGLGEVQNLHTEAVGNIWPYLLTQLHVTIRPNTFGVDCWALVPIHPLVRSPWFMYGICQCEYLQNNHGWLASLWVWRKPGAGFSEWIWTISFIESGMYGKAKIEEGGSLKIKYVKD